MRSNEVADWAPFRALGPEPLEGAITGGWLRDRFKGRSAAVKLLLPLACFLFPTLFIAILGPAALNLIDTVGKM